MEVVDGRLTKRLPLVPPPLPPALPPSLLLIRFVLHDSLLLVFRPRSIVASDATPGKASQRPSQRAHWRNPDNGFNVF